VNLNAIGVATISVADVNNGSSDNCGIATMTISMSDFTCADTGANNVTLTVTDVNGNVSTCVAVVTVVDAMAPTVICRDIIVYLDSATGGVSIDSSDVDNGSADNCGIATMTLSVDTFNCTNVGANIVVLTATDVNGNEDSCFATVTVVDNIAPMAMCKDTTVYLDATGNVSITTAHIDNNSRDNCTFTMQLSDTTFNCLDTGANTVSLFVTDASGNVSVCTSTVTVLDTLAPVMMCKNDTVYLDAAGLGSNMVSDIDNGTTDNCVIASMTLSNYDYTCADTGINNVTLTATDVSGNVDSCMATVLVLDTISPMAMCKDITIYLDSMGMVSIDSSDVDGGSTDNCEIATIAISQSAFDCSMTGPNTVTVTVTDVSGNSSVCTSTVTVLDTLNPIVVCKNATVYLDSTNLVTIDTSDVFSSAWDNCNIDSVWLSQYDFTCMHLGPNNVAVYASDSSGNVDSCIAVVTVVLLDPPTIDTIAVQVDEFNFAQLCLTDDRLLGMPNTYISCKAVTRGNLINYNDTCFTYTQTSVVKYLDTACVVICDDCGICDTTVLIFVPTPSKETLTLGPVIPLSNVDTCVNLESTFMTGMHTGTCDATGTSSTGVPLTITGLCVRYTVPSAVFTGDTACIIVCDTIHGLIVCDTTCIVYLPDTTPPTVICKDDTVYLSTLGTVSVDTSNVLAGAFDNTLVNAVWVSPNMFNCANVGQNTVTVFAQDTNRNMSSCTATVTVLDTISPTAICQNITIRLDSMGMASIVAADVDGGSFDNCDIASIVVSQTSFDCSNLGVNNVTLTVTDIYGNSSTCSATVTVEDLIAPIVYCPGDKQRVVRNTTCSYIVEDFIGETNMWDNCSMDDLTITQSPAAGTEISLENTDTTITMTITDGSGNVSTCSFKVYVRCIKKLIVPQFISPNGDGRNDTWEIPEMVKYPENTVKVFNRWGALVFEQKGYYTGWDGTANNEGSVTKLVGNKMLPEGTYFYIIDLGQDAGFEPYTGYMQIKR
ncbi:MAG: gliding motility-associated C-terminal domain-containing protein, partial [Flavobacteriales bacterium]